MPPRGVPRRAWTPPTWHAGFMTRVNLVGPAEDGLHLVVETDGGERFTLAITDELRHAVRYSRPKYVPADEANDSEGLTPKQIQQRIRAGLTAAELAELTGASVAALEKFEPPVIAERAYVAELARTTRIGREPSGPELGELVIDRLAGRGVATEAIVWDAWREVEEPWQVAVDFVIEGRTIRAQWTFDHQSRTLTAEDDEARWLTETELLDVPIPRRHLSAVPAAGDDATPLPTLRPAMPVVADRVTDEAEGYEEAEDVVDPTEALLEDLDARRGSREPAFDESDLDDEDEAFEGFGPAAQRSAEVGFGQSMPHPAGSALRQEPQEPTDPPTEEVEKPAARKGRASVPSWDEIVFGARNDQG